jgi:hypothetical protein
MRTGKPAPAAGGSLALGLFVALAIPVSAQPPAPISPPDPRQPVRPIEITNGTVRLTYYLLPKDASPEMRKTFKALEFAERDVVIGEELQMLKLEYVRNERTLEALRVADVLQPTYRPLTHWVRSGPFSTSGWCPLGTSGWYLGQQCFLQESTLKMEISRALAVQADTKVLMESLERLEALQKRSAELLRAYAAAHEEADRRSKLRDWAVTRNEQLEVRKKLAAATEQAARKRFDETAKQTDAAAKKEADAGGRCNDIDDNSPRKGAARAEWERACAEYEAARDRGAEAWYLWWGVGAFLTELRKEKPIAPESAELQSLLGADSRHPKLTAPDASKSKVGPQSVASPIQIFMPARVSPPRSSP